MSHMAQDFTGVGWKIPVSVHESFGEFCTQKGHVAQEDAAGALWIWQFLPPEVQDLAKKEAKGISEPDAAFWRDFHNGLRHGFYERWNSQAAKQRKRSRKADADI